jgi:hypothetical protein
VCNFKETKSKTCTLRLFLQFRWRKLKRQAATTAAG